MFDSPWYRWGETVVYPSVVATTAGPVPLAGTRWFAFEHVERERFTPLWAVVLACVLSPTILGLGFLLVRSTRERGWVTVEMRSETGAWSRDHVRADSPSSRAAVLRDVASLDTWLSSTHVAA